MLGILVQENVSALFTAAVFHVVVYWEWLLLLIALFGFFKYWKKPTGFFPLL